MERLKGMSVFAKVVDLGSFTAAARQLRQSVSSVSQTIAKLEDDLQVKLLNRSTRSIGLTEAGRIYYQGCKRMLNEASQVHEQIYAFNNTPIGMLRIGSTTTMARNVLSPITAKLLNDFPGLSVDLITGNPSPDLIAHGLDLVIKAGKLENSALFSRRLGSMPMVLCASAHFPELRNLPASPEELERFVWLEYSVSPYNQFRLIAPDGHHLKMSPKGRFATNDPLTLIGWLKAGSGIAYMPLMWVLDEIKRGEIEILYPRYQSEPRPVYALFTERDKLPLKVQVCIDYLTEYFREMAVKYQEYRARL
mgnify:FL=1